MIYVNYDGTQFVGSADMSHGWVRDYSMRWYQCCAIWVA